MAFYLDPVGGNDFQVPTWLELGKICVAGVFGD